jgi:hypothetical protein
LNKDNPNGSVLPAFDEESLKNNYFSHVGSQVELMSLHAPRHDYVVFGCKSGSILFVSLPEYG